jgi:hypothetical protein
MKICMPGDVDETLQTDAVLADRLYTSSIRLDPSLRRDDVLCVDQIPSLMLFVRDIQAADARSKDTEQALISPDLQPLHLLKIPIQREAEDSDPAD